MKNIFYFYKINEIGGIETFFYYLAKKYKNYDITIYYQEGSNEQIKRLRKYVRVKQYQGERIKCDKAFFNFNLDIIDNVEAKEYYQIAHGDYKASGDIPSVSKKVTKYLGVSQRVCDTYSELINQDVELTYNPIVIDKPKKVLSLISATRLTKEKGRKRIIKLAEMLDEAEIPYIWTIFTDSKDKINNPNIAYLKPRLDIINYIANSDYLVQLSDNEGYCYSVVEALSVGTPVIVTDCPVFKEIGVKNNENGFILDFDLKEVNIKDIYQKRLKFEYKAKEDNWSKILAKGKSTYQKDLKTMVKVKCIKDYFDIELKELKTKKSEPYKINKVRAEELIGYGDIEIVKEGEKNG